MSDGILHVLAHRDIRDRESTVIICRNRKYLPGSRIGNDVEAVISPGLVEIAVIGLLDGVAVSFGGEDKDIVQVFLADLTFLVSRYSLDIQITICFITCNG